MKSPCCPIENRRQNHKHLKHLEGIRKSWPEISHYHQETAAYDIKVVIKLLDDEKRILDQIDGGNGSFAKALAKELYGNEADYKTRYSRFSEFSYIFDFKKRLNI